MLARRKIGALIVFERDVDLDEFVQSGVYMDARPSRELIHSLFVPDGPLHDGAVLIRNGRLRRAGVLLPLSKSLSLDSALGTRHRAAVGITEETDAVAIVVSEERGAMSVCSQGVIRMGLSGVALRRNLLALLAHETPARRRRWLGRLGESVFFGGRRGRVADEELRDDGRPLTSDEPIARTPTNDGASEARAAKSPRDGAHAG